MLKTTVLLNIFVVFLYYIYFKIICWIESLKEQHLFVFTVTFDEFIASLLKQLITIYYKVWF